MVKGSVTAASLRVKGKSYWMEIVVLLLIMSSYAGHSLYIGSKIQYATSGIALQHADIIPQMAGAISSKNFMYCTMLPYPPLYGIGGVLVTMIFGRNWVLMNLIQNTAYLLMTLIFSYLLGRVVKDRTTGIVSMVFIALFPLVYGSFHSFVLDFPLMGLTSMSIYFLFKSDLFRKFGWSALLGISCGWGLMIKQPFAAFLVGPIVYALVHVAIEIKSRNFKPLLNCFVSMLLVVLIVCPYYFSVHVLKDSLAVLFTEPGHIPWYSIDSLLYFVAGLCNNQLTPPFFVAFMIGIPFYFGQQTVRNIKLLIVLWIAVPILIVWLMPATKLPRYFMPAFPAYAVIGAVGIGSILEKWYGKILLVLILVMGVLQYFVIMYGKDIAPAIDSILRGSFDSRGEISLFDTSVVINDNREMIYAAIAKDQHYKDTNEIHILVFEEEGFSCHMLPTQGYFWFKNKKVILDKICHFCNSSYFISYDFMLFRVSDMKMDNITEKGKDVSFEDIRKNYQCWEKGEYGRLGVNNNNWLKVKERWDGLTKILKTRAVISRYGNASTYLYSH
jgi:hypothetical protein